MMYQMRKLPYNYIPEIDLQILELPYVEDELSMFILLPGVKSLSQVVEMTAFTMSGPYPVL